MLQVRSIFIAWHVNAKIILVVLILDNLMFVNIACILCHLEVNTHHNKEGLRGKVEYVIKKILQRGMTE